MKSATPGIAWVVSQSVLLVLLVAAGPAFRADTFSTAGLAVGGILFGSAGALGIAGVVQLGANRTPFPQPRPGAGLVRHGVYAHCRHPLYASLWLAGLSWACLWQNLPTLGVALVQIPFFMAKARAEERFLRKAFPEYASYAQKVKGFIPGLF